jgi:hypothetical protein
VACLCWFLFNLREVRYIDYGSVSVPPLDLDFKQEPKAVFNESDDKRRGVVFARVKLSGSSCSNQVHRHLCSVPLFVRQIFWIWIWILFLNSSISQFPHTNHFIFTSQPKVPVNVKQWLSRAMLRQCVF